jgi:hypothetical protein
VGKERFAPGTVCCVTTPRHLRRFVCICTALIEVKDDLCAVTGNGRRDNGLGFFQARYTTITSPADIIISEHGNKGKCSMRAGKFLG